MTLCFQKEALIKSQEISSDTKMLVGLFFDTLGKHECQMDQLREEIVKAAAFNPKVIFKKINTINLDEHIDGDELFKFI